MTFSTGVVFPALRLIDNRGPEVAAITTEAGGDRWCSSGGTGWNGSAADLQGTALR
ncbi:hypothetical protein ACFL59_10915 [Planctomycetota bacterium]